MKILSIYIIGVFQCKYKKRNLITKKYLFFYKKFVTNLKIIRIIAKNVTMTLLFICAIQPVWWVLIGMIVLPIIVFGTINLNSNGFFEKFKRNKNAKK